MEKPKTVEKTIDSIWIALYGMNGMPGVMNRLDKLEKRPRNNWLKVKDLVLFGIAIGGCLVGFGIIRPFV